MTDYGHDIRFGAFITPANQPARRAVDLAIAAEKAGFDLVSFQDHPYQPSFLDTSTLLAFAASQTSRVHLSANVASLPLRPPLTIAREAATIDRLSGGRFELGLGAGAFWDGIARLGGRRLTAGQGVDALAEGIGLIRQAWDVDDGAPIDHDGPYYRAEREERGPRPAHRIPIWVGAYKPRMLALTGRLADGWLPTLEYVEGGVAGIDQAHARIDEAAERAGRAPRDIRRLLNVMRVGFGSRQPGMLQGAPDEWIEQLVDLALDHGIDTFIVAGDDESVLERVGAEVAPAVREAVAAFRTRSAQPALSSS